VSVTDKTAFAGPLPGLNLRPPGDDRPLGSYVVLMSTFASLSTLFAAWFRASGRPLPDRVEARDLALLTVASAKTARLLSKDRITSPLRAPFTEPDKDAGHGEVDETSRGSGLRRAVGQLLLCPFCLGMWTSAVFTAGLLTVPRFTRWVAAVMSIFFGSELLQIVYRKAEDAL
jgi:hypothetical protein